MKIEIGEYIRTDEGYIQKCIDVDNNYIYADEILSYSFQGDIEIPNSYIDKTRIVKHNKNIIDLIEVGDFINNELVWSTDNAKGIETVSGYYLEEDIKTILTHEQYELIFYRLEE